MNSHKFHDSAFMPNFSMMEHRLFCEIIRLYTLLDHDFDGVSSFIQKTLY